MILGNSGRDTPKPILDYAGFRGDNLVSIFQLSGSMIGIDLNSCTTYNRDGSPDCWRRLGSFDSPKRVPAAATTGGWLTGVRQLEAT